MGKNLKKVLALFFAAIMLLSAFPVTSSAKTEIYSDWSNWSTTPITADNNTEVETKTVSEYWRTRYDYDYWCTWHAGSSASDAYVYSNTGGNWNFHNGTGAYATAYSYTKNVQAYPSGYYRNVAPGYVLSKANGELPGSTAWMDYCKNGGNQMGYALRADQTGQIDGRNQIFFLVSSQDEYHDVTYYRYRTNLSIYSVSYDSNGGTGAPAAQDKVHGTDITLSTQVPTRDGYTFLGWAPKYAFASGKKNIFFYEYYSDISSVYATAKYQPGDIYSNNSDITLYAVWKGDYFISYNANGGKSAPPTQTFSEGDFTRISDGIPKSSNDDMSFLGWSEDANAETPTYQPGDLFAENRDITLYAVWNYSNPNTYVVSYDANGGEGGPDYQVKTQGRALTLSDEIPSKPGYWFAFWSTKPGSISSNGNEYNYGEEIYLKEFTVPEGTAEEEVQSQIKDNLELPFSNFTSMASLIWGDIYYPGSSYTADKSLTLYAQYAHAESGYYVETYTMNLYGQYELSSEEYFESVMYRTVTADYTIPEGFTLNTEMSKLSGVVDNSDLEENTCLTLTVYLDRNTHTITFNDGTNTSSEELYYGAPVVIPNNPEKLGFDFLGWSEDGETVADVERTMPDRDLEYTALWRGGEYLITFTYGDVNNGETFEIIPQRLGEEVSYPIHNPDFTGYTFNGWAPSFSFMELFDTYKGYFPAKYINGEYSFYFNAIIDGDEDGVEWVPFFEIQDFSAKESRNWNAPAAWNENTYNVTYNLAGGNIDGNTENVNVTRKYTDRVDANKPTDPMRDGYAFAGWTYSYYDDDDNERIINPDDKKIPYDIEATALWVSGEYTVTYKLDGVEYFATPYESAVDTFDYSSDVTIRPKAVKEGYTVSDWVFTPELVNGKMPAGDVVANAVSSKNSYTLTVTYEMSNGKNELAPEAHTEQVEFGAQYSVTSPDVDGYTPNTAIVEGIMGAGDVEETVTYSPNAHTVTWNVDGEKTTDDLVYDDEIVKPADPEKEGYTFKGWSEDGETVVEVEETVPDRDIEYIAVWSINQYTITFKYGEVNDNAVYKTITEDFGTEIEEVADPEFEGYTFLNWNADIPETMPAHDTTITALWSINEYKVTYKLDGVEYYATPYESAVDTFDFGSDVTIRPKAEKEGYAVSDWVFTPELVDGKMPAGDVVANAASSKNSYTLTVTYEMSNGKNELAPEAHTEQVEFGVQYSVTSPDVDGYTPNTAVVEGIMGAGDVAVMVTYSPNPHTVTWNVDGEKTVDNVVYGDDIVKPDNPEKEGYEFLGWSEDGETLVEVEETVPDRDIEYIAVWSINSYKITYNVDGVFYDEKTYEYNADVAKLGELTKQGYVFSGWDKEEPAKMPAENLVLNGSFTAATNTGYTVETYVMNLEGEYDKTSETFTGTTGETATAEYTVPEGFTFNAEKSELEGVIAPDESLTLKVYLDRNRHNISFNDGTDITSDELYYGADIVKPDDPTKEGYEFLGWSEDGETVVEVEETVPDRDIEYIAVWSVKQYTITLCYGEVNDNAVYKTITEDYGTEIEEVADPEFEGYTFTGWDSQIPETMPAKDTTITALWAVKEFTVTYKLDGVEYFATPYESAVDTFDYGSYVIIRPKAEKEGYTVSDWVFTPELVDGKMPAGDVVANATSSVNTYTLTFTYGELNEGKVYDKITAEYGSEITAPSNPGFSGYVFREWDKEIPATMPAEDRTINALWDNGVFTITYKLDGEDYPNAENAVDTYFYGETVTIREKAAKEGYTVSDWSFAPALENGKMPAGNVVANATSAVNEYTVTWIVNGSSTVDSYAFGAEIVKPADPEMSGKVFKGWSGEIPATMPARNLVFVASFDAITHTATFVVPDENGSYTDETGTYEVVKTVIFEEGQTTIAEPAVPERDGYVGEWEDYTIGTEDIVIKAIYTIKDSTNTDELITEKTADEKDGGVITINLNAYSKAKTIKTDEKSQPLDVVIIVDQSGSMTDKLRGGETKQKELQNQAKALVASLNSNANATGANHRVAVVGFSMGGKAAGGFSAYQNTEILTVPGGAVNYKDATDSDYKNALMSVKNSYTDITNAISRTKAGGATSADLGFDMAAKIFANSATQAGEPEHKKIIIFITDGVPTTATEFDTGVANCAITRAKYLKAQDVTIYTVAISDEADPNNTTRDYNKFLHATSSNYKAASSVNNLGEGRNEGYFLTVRDSAELQQKLENISIRINPATAGFYAVTLYDTVTKEFTMTVPQETAFRENVIEKYGISNADITVDRKADGTTYVEVRNITPYAYYDSTNVMQGYKADITFDVTANENAVDAGEYPANTDEAGVVLDGYTVGTFEPQSVTVTEDRCIVEFIIGNDTYEIREVNIGDSITAPECSYATWNIPAGTTASNRVEKFFADYGEADRTVTWHIGEDTITQHYATGQIIVVPEIDADLVIAGWSPAVEVCVGYTDLEYTALFSEHTHHYERVSGSGICTEGRAITYKCSVCNAKYTEELPACEHELESVAYKTNDATLVHIFCKNCLYSEKANTLSFSMTYQRSDYFDGTVADLHINNPGNKAYDIRIPLSSLSDKCQANPQKIKIIHYKSDGRTENCSYVIDGDYIVLRCTSFSYYVFTTDEIDESINSNTIDCILNSHQFEYKYNNDATVKKDGTETEVCSHCGAKGKTRTAKGTKLSSDSSYRLPSSFKEQTAAYKTVVTVSVTLKGVPEGAKVYIDGKEAKAEGYKYSAEIGQLKSTRKVKLEVKQGDKVLDSTTLTIKVDNGFLSKLISFFTNFLFNMFKWRKVPVNF